MSDRADSRNPQAPWEPVPLFSPPSPTAASALAELWDECDRAAAQLALSCRDCGHCCDFRRRNHVLFAAKIELDLCLHWAARRLLLPPRRAARAIDHGLCPFWQRSTRSNRSVSAVAPDGDAAPRRCLVWPARPIGCRLYFCDAERLASWSRLSDTLHRRLARLSRRLECPWWYGPALAYLKTNLAHCLGASRRPHAESR